MEETKLLCDRCQMICDDEFRKDGSVREKVLNAVRLCKRHEKGYFYFLMSTIKRKKKELKNAPGMLRLDRGNPFSVDVIGNNTEEIGPHLIDTFEKEYKDHCERKIRRYLEK